VIATRAGAGRDNRRGQALVEFALAIPIFLVLLIGLVEGGRLVAAENTLSQAAREAARMATVQAGFVGASGTACAAPVCPATTTALRTNLISAANRMTVFVRPVATGDLYLTGTALGSAPTGAWTTGNDCASSNGSGNVVSVRIVLPIDALTPIFDPWLPADLSAAATMAIP
jgi:Flp pilus assembly protein TadG